MEITQPSDLKQWSTPAFITFPPAFSFPSLLRVLLFNWLAALCHSDWQEIWCRRRLSLLSRPPRRAQCSASVSVQHGEKENERPFLKQGNEKCSTPIPVFALHGAVRLRCHVPVEKVTALQCSVAWARRMSRFQTRPIISELGMCVFSPILLLFFFLHRVKPHKLRHLL